MTSTVVSAQESGSVPIAAPATHDGAFTFEGMGQSGYTDATFTVINPPTATATPTTTPAPTNTPVAAPTSATTPIPTPTSVSDAVPALPAPSLLRPLDGSTTPDPLPTLIWGSVNGADSYRLEVATDPSFAAPVLSLTVVSRYFMLSRPLAAGQTYYWRASALGSSGTSPWSGVFSFMTAG